MINKITFNWFVQEHFYCSTITLDPVYSGNKKKNFFYVARKFLLVLGL